MTAHCSTEDETLTASGKLRAFLNIYPPLIGACGSAYKTRLVADQMAGRNRIACIEVEYEAGEGLDSAHQSARVDTNRSS